MRYLVIIWLMLTTPVWAYMNGQNNLAEVANQGASRTNIGCGDVSTMTASSFSLPLTFAGDGRWTYGEWIPAEAVRAPTIKPAALVDLGIGVAWEFSDGTDDTIVAVIRIRNGIDRTVQPVFCIGWASATADPGDDSKRAVWQVEYLYTAPGESVAAAAQETLTKTTSAAVVVDGLVITQFDPLGLFGVDDICVHVRVKRLGADGADTLGDTSELVGIMIIVTRNRVGGAI